MAAQGVSLVVNDILKLRIGYYFSPQAGYTVLHYRIASITGGTSVDQQVLLDTFEAPRVASCKALLSAAATFIGMGLQRISPGTPPVEAVQTGNTGIGSVAGDAYARQVTGMVTKRTLFAGRRYRGRVYFPFPGEASGQADATPIAQYIADLAAWSDLFLVTQALVPPGIANLQLQPCLWHRDIGLVTDVSDYIVRDKWATQKRRGSYGKEDKVPFNQ